MKFLGLRADEPTYTCSECGALFDRAVLLSIGQWIEALLCRDCVTTLRDMIRRRRRPLKPRLRLALELLALNQAVGATEEELRAHVGRYSTNTLESLFARGFVTRSDAAGQYNITELGGRALTIGDLEELR